jgi:glycolate oxidase iron-sulfur subunit
LIPGASSIRGGCRSCKPHSPPPNSPIPDTREAEGIIRRCVHCGFCTATCPTYLELGNELDSPRGRIYLIKQMLEQDKPASAEVALHIDRCLSCLSCMTTCPSGVDYMHLIDQARVRIEKTYRRPPADRFVRWLLASVLPYPNRFRAALALAVLSRPIAPLLARMGQPGARMAAMLRLAGQGIRSHGSPRDAAVAKSARRGRVALLEVVRNRCSTPEPTTRLPAC